MLLLKIKLLLILFFTLSKSYCQKITIHNKSKNVDSIAVYTFKGKNAILDQYYSQTSFTYTNPLAESGYIRIKQGKKYKDLILSNKENDIELIIKDSWNITVKNSIENKLLDEFINHYNYYKKEKPDSLSIFCREYLNNHKEYYFANTIKIRLTNSLFDSSRNFDYKKSHFFDHIDFNNSDLLNGSVIPDIYMKYFELYVNYDENGFKNAINTILEKSSVNEKFYNFSLEFLLNLFGKVGPKVIFEHIVNEFYLTNSCSVNLTSENLIAEIKQITSLQEGSKIKNLKLGSLNLFDIYREHNHTFLVFWSSHCPFCKDLINKLESHYKKYSNVYFEIVTISLDTDKESYQQATHSYNWINYCDFNGWESSLIKDLYITKTPSIFLINKDGIIINKSLNSNNIDKEIDLLIQKN